MKFRRFQILLPLIYLLVVGILSIGGAGHGKSIELIPLVSMPTMQLFEWLFGQPKTTGPVALFVAASTFQWFMVGYLIDSIFLRKR